MRDERNGDNVRRLSARRRGLDRVRVGEWIALDGSAIGRTRVLRSRAARSSLRIEVDRRIAHHRIHPDGFGLMRRWRTRFLNGVRTTENSFGAGGNVGLGVNFGSVERFFCTLATPIIEQQSDGCTQQKQNANDGTRYCAATYASRLALIASVGCGDAARRWTRIADSTR